MEKNMHKIELIITELNDVYGLDHVLYNLKDLDNCTVQILSSESKECVWHDDIILNQNNCTTAQAKTFFDNIDNDEYQQYLKLKEKFE